MNPLLSSSRICVFTSPCPRRGRRDSYRDGRGATAAHSPRLFLHSDDSGLRDVKPLPNPLLGQGEGIRRRELLARGFTLLEVMVAIAILGTALVSLLSLHHQSMQSVIRAQEMTRASMLAQAVMTEAELERFPDLGRSTGDFQSSFPGQFRDFRWERIVQASVNFPDVREVKIFVRYGPGQSRVFALVEFLHSPIPPDPNTGRFQ
jgi:general secretion pathway protein I